MKKTMLIALLTIVVLISGCVAEEQIARYTSGKISEPSLSYNPPVYTFTEKEYDHTEYDLPLTELPENYQRDIVERFGKTLTNEEQNTLLDNGVIILNGDEYEKFDEAFSELNREDVPIIITTDSVLHLFHIEFNELLKDIEINKLSPMLNEFLDSVIEESIVQYNGLDEDKELQELSRRNVAYLSVAKKLLDPGFNVPNMVKDEVEQEIERIEDHKGFYQSPLLSKECPSVCEQRLYPGDYNDNEGQGDKCNQVIKGPVIYEGETLQFEDLYREVCIKKCYCEDYSQYIPRGHYTSSEELKQYFKSMMWLGRITFKATGEEWTKQAILLTDSVKAADVEYEGEEYDAIEIWNRIYTVTGFFAGASDDLTFYEYDTAVFNLFNYEFDETENLKQQVTEKMQGEISKMRGPKILGGFEFDIAGNLKDTTQGLRLIGQRYALDSHVLSDMVYNNVGPNPNSEFYDIALNLAPLTQPVEFYTCGNMEQDKVKYWNEVCDGAMQAYVMGMLTEEELYDVCRFMPSGLDVMSSLGSKRADEIIDNKNWGDYCDYSKKNQEMKDLVNSYDTDKWTENLYNTWLWMLQPVIRENPQGYPNWMGSLEWRNKELITALSSWAQLRHDTILYVKQSYTRAVAMTTSIPVMEAKYYGYVEPNPELYARAKYITEYLIQGLEEQGVMTDSVKQSLEQSRDMMARLQEISEKELEGQALTEEDYDYIKNIDSTFNRIIQDLASALTIETGEKLTGPDIITETSLEGKDDAFKTTIIADVHTETNTKKVLEVGTGKIDWLVVAHESKDGRIGLAIGPMFSYYEFPHPMSDRLTDEKWREILASDPPERSEWLYS